MKQLLPLFLLFTISVSAQEHLHCGADEMRIETLRANPKIAEAVVAREAELGAFTREYESTARGGQIYTIPVVFHVIHKYGNENISREQILDGLDVLNATFRKQIPDTADIHPDFKPIHADCEIEFKLATKDPEGNCHSGINRIGSTLTNSGDHRVKELIHWDPSMYLNVYIVSNAAGLAGHAVWPSDADTIPEWDGIVMGHNYMGRIGTSDQTRSVVFAHELGHYLNLHHIWGGNNVPEFYYLPVGQQANCAEDDLVSDTPNTIGWSSCNLNASSCGSPRDNVQNAMDYSYCNVMFTEGQKTRMRACLNSSIANRNNLWTPANLTATGVVSANELCAADFDADKQVICSSFENEITFTEMAYNGEVDSLSWIFENGSPATSTEESPTVAYTNPGTHDVSLTVYANGQSAQVTKSAFIAVQQDSIVNYPFWDWFESGQELNTNTWMEHSVDTESKWELTDVGYHSADHSVMVDNWSIDRMTIDELYSPPIDLSNASEMRLAFKYAFVAQEEPSGLTKLQVQVRKDCESNWSTRLNISGGSLPTAAAQIEPFAPQENSLWMQESINITQTYWSEDFQFRFVYTSEGKNRLFIDDVNVDVTANISFEETTRLTALYPNPANEEINLSIWAEFPQSLSIQLMDVHGRILTTSQAICNQGDNQFVFDTSELVSGVYLARVVSSGQPVIERFIIH